MTFRRSFGSSGLEPCSDVCSTIADTPVSRWCPYHAIKFHTETLPGDDYAAGLRGGVRKQERAQLRKKPGGNKRPRRTPTWPLGSESEPPSADDRLRRSARRPRRDLAGSGTAGCGRTDARPVGGQPAGHRGGHARLLNPPAADPRDVQQLDAGKSFQRKPLALGLTRGIKPGRGGEGLADQARLERWHAARGRVARQPLGLGLCGAVGPRLAGDGGNTEVLLFAPEHDAKRPVRQRALQRLRLAPRRVEPGRHSAGSVRITGIALG